MVIYPYYILVQLVCENHLLVHGRPYTTKVSEERMDVGAWRTFLSFLFGYGGVPCEYAWCARVSIQSSTGINVYTAHEAAVSSSAQRLSTTIL